MAKQVQFRRGTTAQLSSVTGVEGELFVDTTKDTLTVHDGYQAGGFPLLREDLDNLANGAVTPVMLANGTANQLLTTNSAGNGVEWADPAPTVVRAMTFYQNNTQVSIGNNATADILTGTYTKQFDDTDVIVMFNGYGQGSSAGHCGLYFTLNGSRQYEWLDYSYNDWQNTHIIAQGNGKYTASTVGNAGTKNWAFGYSHADGSSGRPAVYWNANQGVGDGRRRNTGTTIIFMEVTP